MKVSILVPVYGVEKYIGRCAESLFAQTYEDIEYVFVDDCSPDNSMEILKKRAEKFPNREGQIRIIHHEKNLGLGAARNTAVSAATGEFLYHVDSDDYIDKDCIRLCVEKQIEYGADIVSVNFCCCGIKRPVVKRTLATFDPERLNASVITHTTPNNIWGRLIRRTLYHANGIEVQKNVNMSEDLNVLPRLLFFAKSIAYVDGTPLHFYECGNINSYTSSFSKKKFEQEEKTYVLLKSFFEEKKSYLKECVEQREFVFFLKSLCDMVKHDNDKLFYLSLRDKIDVPPEGVKSFMSGYEKIAYFLKPYYLFLIFVRGCSFAKRFVAR